MIVTSVSHVYDMWLNMHRDTVYTNIKDEKTGATRQHVEQRTHVDVYDSTGKMVRWEPPRTYE